MSANTLPDVAEDLTAEWLDRTLRDTGVLSTGRVTRCEPTRFGEGIGFVSRIFRMAVTYDSPQPDAPHSLVAKLHSKHPQNDRYWSAPGRNVYEKESRFYRTTAERVSLRTPRCYLAETDWDQKRSILLFEDLGCIRPGDQVVGCTASEINLIAAELAQFNAAFWESDRLEAIEGLPHFIAGMESLQDRFDVAWPVYVEANRDHLPELILEIGEGLTGGGAIAVRNQLGESPTTLCHGDFRLDNLFFIDSQEPEAAHIAVVDWAGLRRGPGVWDLSHVACFGLDPEIRRASETTFLSTYGQTLSASGITDYTTEAAATDYRLSLLTHLQKLVRSFGFEVVNERHIRLREIQRTRVISALMDHCTPDMIPKT